MSGEFPGKIQEMSRKHPFFFPELSEIFREMSKTFPGHFRENSGKFPESVREMSGKRSIFVHEHFRAIYGTCPGYVLEISDNFFLPEGQSLADSGGPAQQALSQRSQNFRTSQHFLECCSAKFREKSSKSVENSIKIIKKLSKNNEFCRNSNENMKKLNLERCEVV